MRARPSKLSPWTPGAGLRRGGAVGSCAGVLLAVACAGADKEGVAPAGETDTDTDVPEPDTDDPADDSGDGGDDRVGTTLAVEVLGDVPGVAVDVQTVVLGAEPNALYQVAFGPTDAGRAALEIAPPDDAWLQDLPDGTRGFVALPFAFIDDDADGAPTPEEQYVGVGLEGLLYVEGAPGETLAAAGLASGWSVVSVDLRTGALTPSDTPPSELRLDPQLIPQDRLLLEATVSGPPDGRRVALLAETVLDGTVMGPVMFDAPVSGTVQVPIEGPPPDAHLQDWGADGTQYRDWRYAVEQLTLYRDTDGSGGWSAGDTIEGVACAQGVAAPLQHSTEPDKAFEALYLATFDILPAWSIWLDLPEGPAFVRVDEAGPITLSDACLP